MQTEEMRPVEARLIERVRALVPGIPDELSVDSALVGAGPLSTVQRVLVRRVVASVCPDLEPLPLDLCQTIAHLAAYLPDHDPVRPLADLSDVARSYVRPVAPSDYEALYRGVFADPDRPPVLPGSNPPPEYFGATLWANASHQFAICSLATGRVLGLATVHDSNFGVGTCRLRTHRVVPPEDGELGAVLDGVVLVIDHLMHRLPVRKIYVDVPGWTIESLSGLVGTILEEEGCLREHDWFGERSWDRSLLALWRPSWIEWRTRWSEAPPVADLAQ